MTSGNPYDLDLADIDEVRRRVLRPVLGAMFHEGELRSTDLIADVDWPTVDGDDSYWSYGWPADPFAARPGDEPKSLYLVVRAGEDERHLVQLGQLGFHRCSPFDIADDLVDSLGDWIMRSRFAPGEIRTVNDSQGIPPMSDAPDGRRIVEITPTREGVPLLLAGVPVSTVTLGIADNLAEDLQSWVAAVDDEVTALATTVQGELAALQEAIAGAESGGMVTIKLDPALAASQRAEALVARESAHLGRWRQLVDKHEPARDALSLRLRAALGPGYYVPTPARIP